MRRLLLAAALVAVVAAVPARALLTAQATLTGTTFATGTWITRLLHLHHDPTPPTGNTPTRIDLAMDETAPIATTLHWYDTCATRRPGRTLLPSATGLADTGACRHVNWRASAATEPTRLRGTATLSIWSATTNFDTTVVGSLTAYLRDLDPATGTYVEIGQATITGANWNPTGTWALRTIAIPLGDRVLPAGHRLELRLMALSAHAQAAMQVAYDTVAYDSTLALP